MDRWGIEKKNIWQWMMDKGRRKVSYRHRNSLDWYQDKEWFFDFYLHYYYRWICDLSCRILYSSVFAICCDSFWHSLFTISLCHSLSCTTIYEYFPHYSLVIYLSPGGTIVMKRSIFPLPSIYVPTYASTTTINLVRNSSLTDWILEEYFPIQPPISTRATEQLKCCCTEKLLIVGRNETSPSNEQWWVWWARQRQSEWAELFWVLQFST